MKLYLTFFLCLHVSYSYAQIATVPLQSNAVIDNFLEANPNYHWAESEIKNKWGVKDTLDLPFFDDFSHEGIYPDSSKWLNNQVYINAHFPYLPPSIGVATFDQLDQQGIPYNNTINKDFKGPGDSLLSQPVNLQDSAGLPYQLSDSIVLSFFVQANGYGYHLAGEDSIRLFFKNSFGNWVQVWSRAGQAETSAFDQIFIPLNNAAYLHKGFQFLFTTYSRQVGNANHWHLDYVKLDKNRSVNAIYHQDYAVQGLPSSLLERYFEMPYEHFILDPSSEVADSLYVRASNLDEDTLNIEVKHREFFNSIELVNTSFAANAANIFPLNSAQRRLESYNFYSGLTGPLPVVLQREFEVREAGVINKFTDNDKVSAQQRFYDYFAYDDGTAELGFGFDHLTNPSNIEGEIAYRFDLKKQDTLYGIGVFFNRSVFDVSREQFTLRVWQEIAVGGATEDILIYESTPLIPQYTNQINRYHIHYPDTLLILPEGEFYIGWHQSSMFNLNVGWDRNSGRHENPDLVSEDLYYKLFGTWSNANLPYGSLMMRPYVGSSREVFASVEPIEQKPTRLSFYPNPASNEIHFKERLKYLKVVDQCGREVISAEKVKSIDVSSLPTGIYWIFARNSSDQSLRSKLLIFAPQ